MKPLFQTCCGSLDLRRGAIVTGLACVLVSLALYIVVVLEIFFWDDLTEDIVPLHFNISSIAKDAEGLTTMILAGIWWRNLALSVVAVMYIIVSNVMLTGALKYRPNMMTTWIHATLFILPVCTVLFAIDLALSILGHISLFPLIPGIVGLILCALWLYGLLCVVSAHEVLQHPNKYRKEEVRKVIRAESLSTPI